MKKLLVIINANSDDVRRIRKDAMVNQELPKGVEQIFDNNFLIDTHTCLPFFVSLVNSAENRNRHVAVFSVDDESILYRNLFHLPGELSKNS